MPWARGSLRDDRGRRVGLIGRGSPRTLAARLGLSPRAAERIEAQAGSVNTWTAATADLVTEYLALLLAIPLLLVALWAWNGAVPRSVPAALRGMSFIVPVTATAAVLWLILRAGWVARTRGIVRGLLAEGRCATCGYDIRGCRAEADGCTVCPECGAAWRVPAGAN